MKHNLNKYKKRMLVLSLMLVFVIMISGVSHALFTSTESQVEEDFIAVLIDGKESSTFPTTSNYAASVTCTRNGKTIDANPSLTWDGSKWKLSVEVTTGNVRCNTKFIQPKPLYQTILADNEVKNPITAPGSAISASNEALLASTEDDYGTSYYFRGAVTNNYVEFANKCWRIVRIGGDNTVKLILHNDNTSNASNPCSSANNSDTAAFAHYDGLTYTSAFNSSRNDNAYVGFMYGTPGSSTYEATHANTNKSTILTNLETWYNNNLKTYESVIDDNVFCNDKNVSGSGLGYGTNATTYMSYERLSTNKSPSLKCNGVLSKITSKIGLITADELVYAGHAVSISGSTSYLQENATGTSWWTLSPDYLGSTIARGWSVNGSSGYLIGSFVNNSLGVRSYISLKSSTNVTGDGTSKNPYKIFS